MGRRLTPQEKKRLAYSRDHYVSAGESRHAFRKNWPKKKAMANQAHRHLATEKIRQLNKFSDSGSIENAPIEVTGEQLRKPDPRKKLDKCGVHSLREYIQYSRERRSERDGGVREQRERDDAEWRDCIIAVERNPGSVSTSQLLVRLTRWAWDRRLFLGRNPAWKLRLQKALAAEKKLQAKLKLKRDTKEAQKRRAETLKQSILSQIRIV
jgi:hypothetical protein